MTQEEKTIQQLTTRANYLVIDSVAGDVSDVE